MAKAKGKGKGKGKKKAVVEIDPNALSEVDKAFYELTITDLNRKLARLRQLTQELEEKNEELKANNEKLDEDRSDIIIYLKRMLQEKTDEIAEVEERITALQETRQDETQKFEEKIVEMEQDYKQMREQLTSENKLLEGKLNSLEEFRIQRDDLMTKFEEQKKAMETQEKIHKRELYDIERKFIISKDQLKKDMETRLLQLSTEFQDATELRIAATTHRVIRENIAVNNELDALLASQTKLYNENLAIKKTGTSLKQQAELHETEKKMALSKVKLQLKVIERLTDDQLHLQNKLTNYKNYELEVYQIKRDMRTQLARIKELEHTNRLLEQNLHHVRCDRTSIETDYLYVRDENDRLSEILMEAVSYIKEALTVRSSSDESLKAMKRENLLNSLFTLLSKAKDKKIRRPSEVTVDIFDATYARGDLGFVPKPVEVRSFVPTTRQMESQTADSFEEFLKFGAITTAHMQYSESGSSREIQQNIEEEESVVQEKRESVLFFDESEVFEEGSDNVEIDIFAELEGEQEEYAASSRTSELQNSSTMNNLKESTVSIAKSKIMSSSVSNTSDFKIRPEKKPSNISLKKVSVTDASSRKDIQKEAEHSKHDLATDIEKNSEHSSLD